MTHPTLSTPNYRVYDNFPVAAAVTVFIKVRLSFLLLKGYFVIA
jgi:hypothetical protein